ncbi:MAG: TSUP family transporter [Gammaproteobacteria bacterium]|nr:TSUP family transporter [Gammaproteobacteria bacterium]
MEFNAEVLLMLFAVAAVAGWVDVIAGGGGLLTIPAMLFAGLPPAAAIATNKVQGSFGTFIASVVFVRNNAVNLSGIRWPLVMTFAGSVAGSWAVLQIDAQILAWILPPLLAAVGLYFLLNPNIDDRARKQKTPWLVFAAGVAPLLGFYDGFFGPGTGSLMALALVWCCGYGLTAATAHAKLLNFVSNISSLIYFILFGDIVWSVGAVMVAGQIIGAFTGARMALQKGATLIRPVVVVACFAMAVGLVVRAL